MYIKKIHTLLDELNINQDTIIDICDYLKSKPLLIQEIFLLRIQNYTQQEIGEIVGYSQRHIGRLIKKEFKEIKNILENNV